MAKVTFRTTNRKAAFCDIADIAVLGTSATTGTLITKFGNLRPGTEGTTSWNNAITVGAITAVGTFIVYKGVKMLFLNGKIYQREGVVDEIMTNDPKLVKQVKAAIEAAKAEQEAAPKQKKTGTDN